MSEHEIIILPRDPQWVPDAAVVAAAEPFMAGLFPDAEYVHVTCSEQVHYYDCGGNFEHIHCPACHTEISVPQWHALMDADYDPEHNSFAMQNQALPCCGKMANLNQLQYAFEQGFARFAISMDNSVGAVEQAIKAEIEEFLGGQPIKIIYRH
ncbi:MAG: hypothetical protein CVV16_05290 [Gammaproteobacteria bacterium HGW-Gammaproteobacteria-6]|nr:MAG: hypothetical protein CVV16_05290 [Gammaproteobacteria bacterium HGW-Gammaproteobacteria-6]